MIISSITDFREAARRRLPRFLFEYADGGAHNEQTLRENVSDLGQVRLRQRVLQGAGEADITTSLFGRQHSLPVVLGPVGIAGMYRRRGEVQAVRAAHSSGVPFCLSTVSLCSLSEVAAAADVERLWFQLYVIRDRPFMRDLLASAAAAGVQTLVFTVDMPVPGVRLRDSRSGMSGRFGSVRRVLQAIAKPAWAYDVGLRGRPHRLGNLAPVLGAASGMHDYMGWLGANFDPSITWQDLDWIRANWSGPLIIKGILDPQDARAAADLGADAIVVSNHGGRQLDGTLSTARALPAIADVIGNRLTVLADSGVRNGLDVVRMLALGAQGVFLGRAWLFALAARGEQGVEQLLQWIARDMRVVMTLIGARTVADISRSCLAQEPP